MFRNFSMMGSLPNTTANIPSANSGSGFSGLGMMGSFLLHPTSPNTLGNPSSTNPTAAGNGTTPAGLGELQQTMLGIMQGVLGGIDNSTSIVPPASGGAPINNALVGIHQTMIDVMQNNLNVGNSAGAPNLAQSMLDIMDDMPLIHLVGYSNAPMGPFLFE